MDPATNARTAAAGGIAWLGLMIVAAVVALGAPPWVSVADAQAPPPPLRPLGPAALGAGKLLIASRGLMDPNFSATVILLLDRGPGGAVGVVLNRRSDVELREAMPDVEELRRRHDPIHLGGPVGGGSAVFVLRAAKAPASSTHLFGDVYASGSVDELKRAAAGSRGAPRQFRVFIGYAGWGQGQLEAEVGRGDWIVAAADAETVFAEDPSTLWGRLIERLSAEWCAVPLASPRKAA